MFIIITKLFRQYTTMFMNLYIDNIENKHKHQFININIMKNNNTKSQLINAV